MDLLNLQYHFILHDSVASLRGGEQASVKRWVMVVSDPPHMLRLRC